ncbi:hypothetical protein AB1207_22035 [Kineococcus endophyticus]|uniref:TrbC/VIRB2 family protein n=1 Tax=Kineococcus endophyticus TaxID=1181883 RepID=A0ABV3PCR6_9ACTN
MHTLATFASFATDAAQGGGGGGFGTGGLRTWISENIVTLALLALGCIILWKSRGGEVANGISIAAGAIVGICFLGMATGTTATELGSWLVGLLRG